MIGKIFDPEVDKFYSYHFIVEIDTLENTIMYDKLRSQITEATNSISYAMFLHLV